MIPALRGGTLQRTRLIRSLRLGEFDVLVGIGLLGRSGPAGVALVAVLDADRGFTQRDQPGQTIGRAARPWTAGSSCMRTR